MRKRAASLHEEDTEQEPWVAGDPISRHDWDNVKSLIYAGFGRRLVARKLNLPESLVGTVFDQLAPQKFPVLAPETKARITELVDDGAALPDIADDLNVSVAMTRVYVKSLGYEPRKLTKKYLDTHGRDGES
jgi:hypothetical protein